MRAPPSVTLATTTFLLATAAFSHTGAQGVLVPRCDAGGDCVAPPCAPDRPCGQRLPWNAVVVRGASHVNVTLGDGVLHYEVDETFINHGGRIGEADYIFPLPRNAAFGDLRLSINGELVGGETMDAQRARSIYEEIVRRQRDPALVEWMGYGMLRARIFPILPGEEKRVVVRFDQVAEREGDALRIDYVRGGSFERAQLVRNASTGTTGSTGSDDRGDERSRSSTFTLTYLTASGYGRPYSPTHELDISTRGATRRINAIGDARELTLLVPSVRGNGTPAITLLANNDGRGDGFALINLVPPVSVHAVAPRDLTFVVDVSGSMSAGKLEQARAAGRQLLGTLGPRDRFRLIDFSTDVRTFRDDFVRATPENIRAASAYLASLTAEGSTNIAAALAQALSPGSDSGSTNRLRLVIFLTDGQPTVGERSADAIAMQAARMRGTARVFTFGLGADVNASLLEQLALQGRGTAQFVRPTEDVERAVSIVASRLTNPVATDVRVSAEGIRLSKVLPGSPIDVFAGQNVVVLARYSGSGSAVLHFDGNSPNGPVHWTQRVQLPRSERGNPFIGRLWATQRVGYLSAERRRAGGNPELDGEIRSLGEQYGIPTEFTAFLVQEPTASMPSVTVASRRIGSGSTQLSQVVVTGAAAATPDRSFESARQATAQRAVTTLAASDATIQSIPNGAPVALSRRVGDRTFTLIKGVWTDTRLTANTGNRGGVTVRVQPFSAAYFRVLQLVPALKPVLALGDRMLVAGNGVVLEIVPDGATTLEAHDIDALRAGW